MREILFRGFHPCEDGMERVFINGKWVKGRWLYGDLMQDRDLNTVFIAGYDYYTNEDGLQREPFQHDVIPETVGQYTGLNDRNGKRIFEGDIIREYFENLENEYGYNYFDCGKVFWYQKQLRFLRTSATFHDDCPKITENREYELIGGRKMDLEV